MRIIPDDPIISSMERTGYPPWFYPDIEDEDFEEEEDEDDEQRD